MKIWIVSSDPFYRDFEKIAENWNTDNTIKISLISKYGYNFKSIRDFLSIYLKFRPAVILTDFGYFGFYFVRIISMIFKINTRISFFLRGNFWLEESMIRNDKSN